MSSKTARAVRAIREKVESSGSESDSIESDEDMDRRWVCVTTTPGQEKSDKDHRPWQKNNGERDGHDCGGRSKACTHCGSTRHDDRGFWKRLSCHKSGRKGHPSDKCFFVCAACGQIHESGKCPMEELFNSKMFDRLRCDRTDSISTSGVSHDTLTPVILVENVPGPSRGTPGGALAY
uniref:Uncharacterized protein n=1 Tax=Hyaloperonospora arabidopsidis (strain Emoy2) TaxID=559515 RepID=M4BNC0_HYAAE